MKIIKAGIQDTVQDSGRHGYQHLGINPGGVMDRYAMEAANALVGNEPGEAVIEMNFPASAFLFDHRNLVSLAGADFSPSINGEPVPLYHPIFVGKNDVLHFHKPISGARCYLAVRGGFDLARYFESRSTNIKAGFGGFNGRSFQKNDELKLRSRFSEFTYPHFKVLPWSVDPVYLPDTIHGPNAANEIFVLPGREWNRLAVEARENFLMTSFIITQQSDRMGYRLNNIPLPVINRDELVSSAVSFGTVQLLPDGKLIILMADHQTTGGYPRIAHVISAHHSRLAQMKAGDKLQFVLCDQQKAEEIYLKQQNHLKQLRNACEIRLTEYFEHLNASPVK